MFSPYDEDPFFQWLVKATRHILDHEDQRLSPIRINRKFSLKAVDLENSEFTGHDFRLDINEFVGSKFLEDYPAFTDFIENKGLLELAAILSGSKALIPDLGEGDLREAFDKVFEEARFFGSNNSKGGYID